MTSLPRTAVVQVAAGNFPSRTIERRAMIALHQQQIDVGTIAWLLNRHCDTVARWHDRFAHGNVLDDKARPGAPPKFDDAMKQQLFSFYTQTPPPPGCRRWTMRWAEQYFAKYGIEVDHCTLMRILHQYGYRPHKRIDFLHLVDPDFFQKAEHIISVYRAGHPYLFCFDECPHLQAITRDIPDMPGDDGSVKVDVRYHRHGTTDLIAFLNVANGHVFHRCTPDHTTATLIQVFTDHVNQQPHDAELHYICDNLNPHFNDDFCKAVARLSNVPYTTRRRGCDRREWLQQEDKRIVVHFVPFHSSWLNMVESWFSIFKSHCLDNSWFHSVAALIDEIVQFIETWNEEFSHPFTFQYTGDGLQEAFIGRCTRLLLCKTTQPDCKFLTNQLLIINKIWTDYRHTVPTEQWSNLFNAFIQKQSWIERIISSDDGPIRRKRGLAALQNLQDLLQSELDHRAREEAAA